MFDDSVVKQASRDRWGSDICAVLKNTLHRLNQVALVSLISGFDGTYSGPQRGSYARCRCVVRWLT